MKYQFDNTTIDVCVEKMQSLGENKFRCECPPCRIFREFASTLPADVKEQFLALHLDVESPDEVFDAGQNENGDVLWGGWWNLFGKIVEKGDTPCRITDEFEVTFTDDSPYTQKWFRDSDCVQMRFLIRVGQGKPLGKKYRADDKHTFCYHIHDAVCAELEHLIGGELVAIASDSVKGNGERTKCHEAELYVKCNNALNIQKISLTAARDVDTCFDGIDRMVFSAAVSPAEPGEVDGLAKASILPCPIGRINEIKIFESTIAGERDRVVYDSHLMIALDSGETLLFRVEPDGEEVFTVFPHAENLPIEAYLRVSDTWFVHAEPIFDAQNEVIGLKHFYETETKVRCRIPE